MVKSVSGWIAFALALALSAAGAQAAQDAAELLRTHLYAGRTADAVEALRARLGESPQDDQARFALGAVQFVQAVERLAQAMHRHGLRSSPDSQLYLPFFRLPVADNPSPEPLTYDKVRDILQRLVDDLALAEKTLADVRAPDVDLSLNIGLVRLDMNGDGRIAEDETLWRIYQRMARQRPITAEEAQRFAIDFDAADVAWLRAYCHLLMGLGELFLAHDWRDAFEHTFHTLFPRAKLPYGVLVEESARTVELFRDCMTAAGGDSEKQNGCRATFAPGLQQAEHGQIADIIAFVHLNHWPVVEPERMARTLSHLESMVALSRESWRRIVAETDDRNEWIPNPMQTGVIPGMEVTQARVDGWLAFLDEFDALLQGRKLLPHWRLSQGINLRRVFLEPRTFDIVLWIQGSAALPYLEDGPAADGRTWERIVQLFEGDFLNYAIWFN